LSSSFIRSTSPSIISTTSETLEPFRSVSVTSQQSEIERPLSTTFQQPTLIPITKKQQSIGLVNHVLKIIESLGEENRTSLRGILQRRTNVDLKKGYSIETLKENNNKLVKAIMGLDLPITSSTYYDIITALEQLPTIVSKKRKLNQKHHHHLLNLVNIHQHQHHHHHHNFHHHHLRRSRSQLCCFKNF
jgi:hypothetical protein